MNMNELRYIPKHIQPSLILPVIVHPDGNRTKYMDLHYRIPKIGQVSPKSVSFFFQVQKSAIPTLESNLRVPIKTQSFF